MATADEAQRPRHPFRSAAIRWLSEPLLHFLLLGAVLFGAYRFFEPRVTMPEASTQISLTPDELLQLILVFQAQWQRPPTQSEFSRLVESKVQEEVLYREAVAMGLDKDDTIVKRRMTQKMQFLAEDVAAAYEPTTAELEAWYARNAGKFALPGRVNFRHLYFSPDRRGARAHDDAGDALAKLAGQPTDSGLAASLGDPFMLQDYYADRTPEQLAKEFGPAFAQAIFRLGPGTWQGPIESGFGWHLVLVNSVVPGRAPSFAEVESDVKTAWLGERKAEAWRKAYDAMRAKYTVRLPALLNAADPPHAKPAP
jgi:peptidyl-prolyl cis-trans isomerase C